MSLLKIKKKKLLLIAQDMEMDEYIHSIKQFKENNPNSFIIILSSKPYPQLIEKYKEWGADFILDKSTEFNKLSKVFQELNPENTG